MDNSNKKIATMKDVALRASVSPMTVSRVLRGEKGVSESVIKKVNAVIADIGYVHNKIAGSMTNTSSNLVGIAIPTMRNRVFNDVIEGINAVLVKQNYRSMFGLTDYSIEEEERFVHDVLSWRPNGIILSSVVHSEKTITMLRNNNTKVVEIMDMGNDIFASAFGFSNHQASYDMAAHLLGKGYKKFAFLGAQFKGDHRTVERYNGFMEALHEQGIHWTAEFIKEDIASVMLGQEGIQAIIAMDKQVDVVYCSNDDIAVGVYLYCQANNIRVPEDLAIAGFNGLSFLQALPQQITTVSTPRYEIGKKAAEYIISDTQDNVILDMGYTIVPGDTT